MSCFFHWLRVRRGGRPRPPRPPIFFIISSGSMPFKSSDCEHWAVLLVRRVHLHCRGLPVPADARDVCYTTSRGSTVKRRAVAPTENIFTPSMPGIPLRFAIMSSIDCSEAALHAPKSASTNTNLK